MKRALYAESIEQFLRSSVNDIVGELARSNEFALEKTQEWAWEEEISILRNALNGMDGAVYFEYNIPRMGRRIDVVVLIGAVIFVLEFKVGESAFTADAMDQVWDYALDLKNFHESSHDKYVVPILIATKAKQCTASLVMTPQNDRLLHPVRSTVASLRTVLEEALLFCDGEPIERRAWEKGRYCPTPTIIEAALSLYRGHSVQEISRSDASAFNLSATSQTVSEIIRDSKQNNHKAICFVTGVPGAGKTLVGLNIATSHHDNSEGLHSVFLSGNGPLVSVLREALTQDRYRQQKVESGKKTRKCEVMKEVKSFIQNVHNFRDECLLDVNRAPIEHVALFDEAQRAWNKEQTVNFMARKKKRPGFDKSEPEYLISCLERHSDWAVIVCLVGGGQEINTGEAGISEWLDSLNRSFPDWRIYISPRLKDSEYAAGQALAKTAGRLNVFLKDDLHLSVSMRSFRSEHVSSLVKALLDLEIEEARDTLTELFGKYPIVLTRDLTRAKRWLREQARGSERYGIVVSSQAERLKPHAIDVRSPVDPKQWFLKGKDDVRSSYYLEDVATEFHIQGLELDWVCVTWDADFRHSADGWEQWSFRGNRWNRIRQMDRKIYQKNAYRVLLTRARQGMVIVVPSGSDEDPTRQASFYDPTFDYLGRVGIPVLP